MNYALSLKKIRLPFSKHNYIIHETQRPLALKRTDAYSECCIRIHVVHTMLNGAAHLRKQNNKTGNTILCRVNVLCLQQIILVEIACRKSEQFKSLVLVLFFFLF